MSGREWQPGDVVRVRYGAVDQIGIIRPRREARGELQVLFAQGGFDMVENLVRDGDYISLVAAVDPEDPEQAKRLAFLYDSKAAGPCAGEDMQAALREFANPTPPKPDEPTGLGAVVQDADGQAWILVYDEPGDDRQWAQKGVVGAIDEWRDYADISAVRVLSEGVTA